MGDFNNNFAKKLLEDEDFDTIFGAEEDDDLMSCLEADEFIKDERDNKDIEDGIGAMGKGSGLGSDLGTDHETKGAFSAKNDTSDEDIISAVGGETFDKGGQLNAGDNAQGKITDGSTVKDDFRVAGDNTNAVDKEFAEAYKFIMEELQDMPIAPDEDGQPAVPAPYENPTDDIPEGDIVNALLDSDDEDDDDDDDFEDSYDANNSGATATVTVQGSTSYNNESADLILQLLEGDVDEDDVREERNTNGVEDKGSDNLGDDLGPNHDEKKPSDDSSDEDILAAVSGETLKRGDQFNAGDNAQSKITDGGSTKFCTPDCARVNGDDSDSSDDSFKEATASQLEDDEDDEDDADDIIDLVNGIGGGASDVSISDLDADDLTDPIDEA